MGHRGKFYAALGRRPLKQEGRAPGAGASKGIEPANIPWEVFVACTTGDGIDTAAYQALCTTIDYDGLLDLMEMRIVHSSWVDAHRRDAEAAAGRT